MEKAKKNLHWYEIHLWVESLTHDQAKTALNSTVESLVDNCYLAMDNDGKPVWRWNKVPL